MRITLDFDSNKAVQSACAVCVLRILSRIVGRGEPVMVRRSASGRGTHLKLHGLKISFKQSLVIRWLLGDDRVRVELDLERVQKAKQLLFTVKDGSKAEMWRAV